MIVKYPNPSIKNVKSTRPKTYGMLFETALNISNDYYLCHNKAVIYKKPTPVQIVKVDYPSRNKAKIVEAYFKIPSTTDYNGIYRGKYIDYEAKETNNLSFSFTHIFEHQIDHLKKVDQQGGIAFVIIFYKKINKVYVIDIKQFINVYEESKKGGVKAIHHTLAEEVGIEAIQGYTPPIDYLSAIDKLYFLDKNWLLYI